MDPTCGLAEKFRDIVLDQIWEQLHYLFCYGQNIEQLYERLEELTLERSSIQHRIDEATNNAEQIDEKVLYWMDKVDEISEQVQKLHQESQGKRECSITSCPNPWLRYKLSKRATEMAQQVVEICGKGNFNTVSYRVPPQSMPQLTNRESTEGINSRVPIMNQIMEALRNPCVNMIGLCGLGGVGKTTIAKEVKKDQKMFEKVVMATVSNELNFEKIQGQIAEKLGMQLNERTEDVRASRLRDRLKQEENMLLILDDLWEELDLGRVGIPFADVENNSKKNEGCKILLTSRDETLLSNRMNCQKIIKVGVLLEDEALKLFKKIAELPIDSSRSDLMSIATEIVRKCGGLPLAIATAAKALRGKDLNEWKDFRARLKNPLRRNVTGIKEVDTILKVSVDLLSSENKDIFLLTGMLSHDPLIEELLMYTVGLDILKGIDNMKEAHEGIFAIVNKLKSLNLFLDSFSSHRVTIHDVVRDVTLSIASNELHAFVRRRLKEWPDENILEGCKVICLQESDISGLPEELQGPRLEFFLLNSTKRDLTIPSMFFKSSKELKVLKLTNVQFLSLRSLSFLQKLKALCLHSCLLEDITEVRSLKKLKVLSLAYSKIQQLPVQLAELTSLQMLNLSNCSKLKVIPPKILCSLKKLEVLSMRNSFGQWKVEGSTEAIENASLDELKGLPIYCLDIHIPNVSMLPEDLFLDMNLERYKILIGKHWQWWEVNYETSKTLKLEIESSIHLKPGVRKLLEGVEDLHIYGSNGHENVLYSHDGRGFPSLKHLQIESNLEELTLEGKEAEMIGSDQFPMYHFPKVQMLYVHIEEATTISYASLLRSFPNLERLELWGDFEESFGGDDVAALAPRLSTFTLGSISKMISLAPSLFSSPYLTHLQVRYCYRLTILMTSSAAQCLVHLTHLSISNCDRIEEIITKHEGEDGDDQEIVFNKLEFLELDRLPRLKKFCGHNYTFKFPFLDQLTITRCPKFKVFSPGTIDAPSLKSVQLLQSEIWGTNLNKMLYQQRFVASRKLVLDEDDAIMIRNIDQFPADPYPQVEILGIERIDDEGLTIPYALLERFSQLKELHVKHCSFKEIFPSNVPPSSTSFNNLTKLKASKCHHLVYLVTNSIAKNLVNLETLEIDDCKKMEEIVREVPNEDVEGGITFNGLRILKLADLPRLKTKDEDKRDFNIEDRATNNRCRSIFGHNTVLFPKLEILELSNSVNNLISLIWDEQILHDSFSNLKTLILESCDFIKVVPLHLLKSLNNLEKLRVNDCNKLEMVFGFDDLNDYKEKASSLVAVPLNLKHLEVKKCYRLTTLMTSSAARSLVRLTHLSIFRCDQIEEIITKQEGDDDDDKKIFFSKLEFLELNKLLRLKRFCCHNYTFKFPLLKCVTIRECPLLTMFCPGDIHAPLLKSVQVSAYEPYKRIWKNDLNTTIQHRFAFEEVISTTESMLLNADNITVITEVFTEVRDLYVESFQDEGINFPYSSLERFPKLVKLYVEHSSFEEIFPSHDHIVDFEGKVPPFKELRIAHLDQLKCIWNDNSQLPPIHQNLAHLIVKSCYNLVKLAPSSASFQNLKWLKVSGCDQLIHLVTSSTAKSFVSLIWLLIKDCKKMEEILMNETNEDVQGAITFNQLWSIKLTDMPSLKMFSSQSQIFEFPKLENIEIRGCPEMKMFCQGVLKTPKLSEVKIEDHDMKWEEEGDLNKTIEMLSSAKG